jgi:1-acylglycerone phosphate reductase
MRLNAVIGITGIMPFAMTAAYNGSKAALAQWSETLRLELEPLDIKVVTVITGQVGSNLPNPPKLRNDSIYKPIEAALGERAKGHKGM